MQGESLTHKREAFAVTAFSIALSVLGCTFQTHPQSAFTIPKDVIRPNDLTSQVQQEEKHLSARDSESDCVLTTGDIHLWCKWISRYY
jgi:hypothetical protein